MKTTIIIRMRYPNHVQLGWWSGSHAVTAVFPYTRVQEKCAITNFNEIVYGVLRFFVFRIFFFLFGSNKSLSRETCWRRVYPKRKTNKFALVVRLYLRCATNKSDVYTRKSYVRFRGTADMRKTCSRYYLLFRTGPKSLTRSFRFIAGDIGRQDVRRASIPVRKSVVRCAWYAVLT